MPPLAFSHLEKYVYFSSIELFFTYYFATREVLGEKIGIHTIMWEWYNGIVLKLPNKTDEVIKVSYENAIETSRNLAKQEGLLVGISAGANVYVASSLAQQAENKGKTIVTILCDTGERYLSAGLYEYKESWKRLFLFLTHFFPLPLTDFMVLFSQRKRGICTSWKEYRALCLRSLFY